MPSRIHRDTVKRFVIGVIGVVVIAAAIAVFLVPTFGGPLLGKSYTYVTAAFDDVGTLNVKADVRESSIAAGKVSEVRYEGTRAIVTMRLDGDEPVYRNASAEVLDQSALAQKFVDLDRGTPEAGPLGDAVIEGAQSTDASNIQDVLDVFDDRTRPALQGTITELAGGLGGRAGDINGALRTLPGQLSDLENITRSLSSPRSALEPLLVSANRVTGRFGGRDRQLRALINEADTTLQALNVDDNRPGKEILAKLPPTLREARSALDAVNQPLADVESTVQTIRPGGKALGAATPDLRGVLREAVPPLDRVPDVADTAEPAVSELTEAVVDLRPLAPRVRQTLGLTRKTLDGLSPYADDIGLFFAQEDLLRGQFDPARHFFAAQVAPPGTYSASLPDPLVRQDFYPKPGTAAPNRFQNGGPR